MVGQRLQKYLADFGLEPRDVGTVITTFLGAKYVTLCVFIGFGARFQPMRRLFPRPSNGAWTRWTQVKSWAIKTPPAQSARTRWGGWYGWAAEHYWQLSDKMQASLDKNRIWQVLASKTGMKPGQLVLGVAEGTILCKVSFPIWGPLELWIIMNVLRRRRRQTADLYEDGTLSQSDLLGALDLASNSLAPTMVAASSLGQRAPVAGPDAKALKQQLLVKWATLSNAFDKMDLDGNHRLSRQEWASGLAELDPPLPSSAAAYLFEGIDALRDGHLTPPELQGTLDIGQLFQSQEALRKVLHWDKATMQHHAKASSWIHDARPHWQQSGDDKVVKGPAEKSVKDSQKLPLVQSMLGAFLTASDAFDSMDQDHSDDASVMEFKETLAHFQPPISGFQAEQAFRNLDRDGNGKVSRAEFAVLNAAMPTGGSLNQNMQQLMSKAEEEFRKQASKWAGGMKQACIQLGTQVSFQHFQSAIRSFEPLLSAEVAQAVFNQMDSNHDGFIDENECHLSLKDFRKTMSSSNSLRNTFVVADQDNDHQLSEEEFDRFGHMLDPHISKGKYAIFFEDALDTDHDGKVGLPTLETLLGSKKAAHDDLLSAEDLSSYDLPAIMHGKCIFTALDAKVSPGLRDKVGEAFATALGAELSLKIQIVGVQEIAHPTMGQGKEFDLLYTSKTPSGEAAIRKLHDQATQIQATVQEAIRKVTTAGTVQAWCSSTLDFYGPKAAKLPKGSKIKEIFGQLPPGRQ